MAHHSGPREARPECKLRVGHPVGLATILKVKCWRHLPLAQARGVRSSNRSTGPICPAAPVAAHGCPHSRAMTSFC